MTGITVDIELEAETARTRLDAMIARMDALIGFYRNVGEHLMGSIRENFRRETSPEGVPWEKLRPSTVRNRMRRGRSAISILRETGTLINSINARPTNEQLTIGSAAPYAAIHQLGGEIDMPARRQTIHQHYDARTDEFDHIFRKRRRSNFATDVDVPAHKVVIPARPYIGVSPDDERSIVEIAQEWLLGK